MLGYYLLMGGAIVFRLLGVESGVRYLTGGTEVAAMTLAAILSFFVTLREKDGLKLYIFVLFDCLFNL